METKVCKKCNVELPLSNYYKNKKYYTSICKECSIKIYKETKGREVLERKKLKIILLEEKGVKDCNVCNLELPLAKFKKTATGNYVNNCKDCYNKYQRDVKSKRNANIVKPKLIVKDGFKICNKCNVELPLNDFYIRNKERGTDDSLCKKCRYKSRIEYLNKYNSIPENREKIRENNRKNDAKKRLEARIIRENIKAEKQRLIDIELEMKRKDKEQRDLLKEERRKLIEYRKTDEYKNEMKRKDKERRHLSFKNKMKNDELFAFKKRLRNLIRGSFRKKGYSKFEQRTEDIIGIKYSEFKIYMESKFVDGMNWDNRSEWHIDSIIPLATAKTREELVLLSHYTNLQPLWAMDNLKKGDKLISSDEGLEKLKEYSRNMSEDKMQKILRKPNANLKKEDNLISSDRGFQKLKEYSKNVSEDKIQKILRKPNAKGYYFHKRDNKYIAKIKVNGKVIILGRFNAETEAAQAYQNAKLIYHVMD